MVGILVDVPPKWRLSDPNASDPSYFFVLGLYSTDRALAANLSAWGLAVSVQGTATLETVREGQGMWVGRAFGAAAGNGFDARGAILDPQPMVWAKRPGRLFGTSPNGTVHAVEMERFNGTSIGRGQEPAVIATSGPWWGISISAVGVNERHRYGEILLRPAVPADAPVGI